MATRGIIACQFVFLVGSKKKEMMVSELILPSGWLRGNLFQLLKYIWRFHERNIEDDDFSMEMEGCSEKISCTFQLFDIHMNFMAAVGKSWNIIDVGNEPMWRASSVFSI